MKLEKISFKDLIKPIEDPGKNYPFSPNPINKTYSDFSKVSRFSYKHQNLGLYEKRKSMEYGSTKPFSGSYEEGGSSSYAFSSPKSSSGNYKMAG